MIDCQVFDVNHLIQNIFNQFREIDFIVNNQYCIVPSNKMSHPVFVCLNDNKLIEVEKNIIHWIKNELLNQQGLCVGKIKNISRHCDSVQQTWQSKNNANGIEMEGLLRLRRNILASNYECLSEILNRVCEYLKSRRTDKGFMIHHDHIQLLIGEIAGKLKFVSSLYEHQLFMSLAQKELNAASKLLAKLGGGRAFLKGNIVEINLIFDLIYSVYFGEL